ncbi:hypothetical protein B0T20DRAFT_476821 [Sordaria brevicollis]|uniref:Uncharacterized protein n=1 Tax=Sordaria brevicollis TaxID=83679 RepID=A0AAE0PIJ7_SORBR|nr:hypothetical protein B0T20DRAFT_476821 [Sordaria brevicollis]
MPTDHTRSKRERDRSRSPHSSRRSKTDKGKGKEKDVLVRKRVKEGESPRRPNPPSWLLWMAGATPSKEKGKKHEYSLEKRGKGKDREHKDRNKKKYLKDESDDEDGYASPEEKKSRKLPETVQVRSGQRVPREDDLDNLDGESVYEANMRRQREHKHRRPRHENP